MQAGYAPRVTSRAWGVVALAASAAAIVAGASVIVAASVVVLAGAGHMMMAEAPDELLAALRG